MILNHVSARLSELDLRMAQAVPPGGNWRDIPESVPSARLAQIRESFAAGQGSRSTYYGRLRPDRPAYTIGTYYNRPGNGCFLHYDYEGGQHRTLSHREAARLQSFPDRFEFTGSQRAVCQQIGNAVPPLLAFQIANVLGESGAAIDVFSGAGGLALGFEWAGWTSLAAIDNDKNAVATFNANIGDIAFCGDMNDPIVHRRLAKVAATAPGRLALIGGPPCQGFSTGGKKRSVDDIRNQLHEQYAKLVAALRPDVFVFENVLGLLTIANGQFVTEIMEGLERTGYSIALWKLNAAQFGIPQRRERVVIVGVPHGRSLPSFPRPWTVPIFTEGSPLPLAPTVKDAVGDLPGLCAGLDGSALPYRTIPLTGYQRLMRGMTTPRDYLRGSIDSDQDRQSGALSALSEVA